MTFFFHNADDTRRATRDARHAAFTLIETALALFAISLGLLGIFGLARHGLKNGADSEAETRCTLLADTVFETLKSKNDELIARKYSLSDWWFYWLGALSSSTPTIYLPALPEFSSSGNDIGLYANGTPQTLGNSATAATEIKWNPIYTLTLSVPLKEADLSNTQQIYAIYESGEIDVTLTIHPGLLQSGADARTYYATLTYAGGLP